MNGGYFLGSTTLVAGISGVGKSVMALQYIAEGARRGERSLMLTLDEQVPQVLRNAASIGIDLQPAIDRGVVRLYYDPPQEIEIDRHFHKIEQIVEEFKPRRVVIDSLSTYGSSLGTQGRVFRDFFHALVALMKEHQIAAVYNHENPEMLGMSSMMGEFAMSSLVDNIILHELGRARRHLPARADGREDAREPGRAHDARVRDRERPGHARAAAATAGRAAQTAVLRLSRPDLPRARAPAAASRPTPPETKNRSRVDAALFGSDLWKPALDKFAEATGLTVELFGARRQIVLGPPHLHAARRVVPGIRFRPGPVRRMRPPLPASDCSATGGLRRRSARPDGRRHVARARRRDRGRRGGRLRARSVFPGAAVQRWAKLPACRSTGSGSIVRQQPPVPERRLKLHGELLQVLGDALLRESYRTRQYKDMADKLKAAAAAKDEFLAVVSHELRSPLTPITGWASVLKKAESLEQVRQAAEAIEHNALLQSRMVEDLIDLNRVARDRMELELETLELSALVRRVLESSAQILETKTLDLQIVDAGEPLPVQGDAVRLEQVFGNILSNAVKFTPAGGSIRVTLGLEADSARVVIADTGKGIAPDFLPHVFEMFRQQKQGTHRGARALASAFRL